MSASARPRGRDLRAVYTLAGECRDLGDDPRLWRARFAAGLGRLVDADLVIGGELAGFRAGRPRDLGAVEWGWDHGLDRRGWLRALELLATDPTYSPLIGVYAARDRGGRALPRRELVGDRAWRRSAVRDQVYRVIGIDHPVFCFPAVPGSADEVAGAVLG
ncbi:MAG: hypothetical protein K2X87_04920, partial [Gemmataceae bacterium]|nr:hypothetical protein [Gemmataceae bacterium]